MENLNWHHIIMNFVPQLESLCIFPRGKFQREWWSNLNNLWNILFSGVIYYLFKHNQWVFQNHFIFHYYAYNIHVLSVTLTNTSFSMDIEIISKFTKKMWKNCYSSDIYFTATNIYFVISKNSTMYRNCGVMIKSVGRDKKN